MDVVRPRDLPACVSGQDWKLVDDIPHLTDCRTYIHEELQTVNARGTRQPNLVGTHLMTHFCTNCELTVQQASNLLSTFSTLLKAHLRKMPAGADICQRQLEQILAGAAEVVLEHEAGPPCALVSCGAVMISKAHWDLHGTLFANW